MQFHEHQGDKSRMHQMWTKVLSGMHLFLKVTYSIFVKGENKVLQLQLPDADLYEVLKACGRLHAELKNLIWK